MRRADLSQAIARYLVQTKFPEGRAPDVRDADARREEIEGALVPLGGALHDHYFTSGDFDEVMIIDVPETVSAAACVMAALDGREVSGTVPLLALTEQAIARIEQVDDGEAALRELWASLLEIRTLRASDPGIRMAAQDLYEAAAALVIQSRPGTTVVDMRRWRLLKQAGWRLRLRLRDGA